MSAVVAPQAPGRLGEAIDPHLILTYLQGMEQWLGERRRELDALDAAVQAAPQGATMTGDIMLSMSLWQAVKQRLELVAVTWDSGRVGITEQERISSLVWGRLDTTVGVHAGQNQSLAGMNLSMPEACRLSDALASSLRSRLNLDPDADALSARVRALRAQMERLRDQIQLEPAGPDFDRARAHLATLAARTEDLHDKLTRGGDIGGLVGPLEIEATTWERDLIVGATNRRRTQAKLQQVRERVADLLVREEALTKLVAQTVAAVDPAPKYAVPDVAALGEIPTTSPALEQFETRLDAVEKAFQIVQTSYSTALSDRDELIKRLEAAHLKATTSAVDDDTATTYDLARRTLEHQPTQVTVARSLVEAYVAQVSSSIAKEAR